MATPYASMLKDVTKLIGELGTNALLDYQDGTTAKVSVVYGESKGEDLDAGIPVQMTADVKVIYLSGDLKKPPTVGSVVRTKLHNWQINSVQDYTPADLTIAYKCEVRG
jgi:hypothetical protein